MWLQATMLGKKAELIEFKGDRGGNENDVAERERELGARKNEWSVRCLENSN